LQENEIKQNNSIYFFIL